MLCDKSLKGFAKAKGFQTINVLAEQKRIVQEAVSPPNVTIKPEDLAYLIYTSGSTGKPKGVCIHHSNVCNLLLWAQTEYSTTELSGFLAGTSICFDLSVFEIFLPLISGGRIVLVKNILELTELDESAGVKLINTVPSAARQLLEMEVLPESVETINLAGEPLSRILVEDLYQAGQISRVVNLYAPSETTTYSTIGVIEAGKKSRPHIGRPIANTYIYILDEKLNLLPIGVEGELYISGKGVAGGYHRRPKLSKERFIQDPFRSDQTMYRTGDQGKWLSDGTIELAGRADDQVKIRGYRIEFGRNRASIRKL